MNYFLGKTKQCLHCTRNTLIPYDHQWTCIASGYNVKKRKNELAKNQR